MGLIQMHIEPSRWPGQAPVECCDLGVGTRGAQSRRCRLDAFRASGGVATGAEIATLLRPGVSHPVSVLARWIVARQAITLRCQAEMMLPLFQFDFQQGCVRAGVSQVVAELSGAMSPDDVALWFGQPNDWLGGLTPAGLLATDVPAVLSAARADRFIVTG